MVVVSVNDALIKIGQPRKYQLYTLLWCMAIGVFISMQALALNFTQADMSFRCGDNGSRTDLLDNPAGYPINNNTSNSSMSYPNYQHDTCPDAGQDDCSHYIYSSTSFKSSVKSEFDLVCDRSIWATVSNALFLLMRIPAGFISAQFSDRLGRKKAVVVSLLLLGVCGLGEAYSTNMYMYIAFHSLLAFPVIGFDSCSTLLSEITCPPRRPHMLIGIGFSWATGILLLSLFGYYIRDWRMLQMAISVPPFVLLIASNWLLDESPHWLYSQGRIEEAQSILDKMAQMNSCESVRLQSDRQVISSLESNSPKIGDLDTQEEPTTDKHELAENDTCLRVVTSPVLLKIFLVCVFGWLACSMGYNGLAYGLDSLAGDPYINNIISGLTEYASYAAAFLCIPGGRKKIFVILLFIGGVALIANAAIQDIYQSESGMSWLIITLTMIGRLSVSTCWQILYIWCLELFPTTVRLTMFEASMMVGHIGSASAPFLNDAHKLINDDNIQGKIIAPSVYGICLIVSSVLSLYLPETNNRDLPVNIQETGGIIQSSNSRDDPQTIQDENVSTFM